jgi:hypothetical protein
VGPVFSTNKYGINAIVMSDSGQKTFCMASAQVETPCGDVQLDER